PALSAIISFPPIYDRLTDLPGSLEAGAPFETPIVITLYSGRVAGRNLIRRFFDRAHEGSCRRGRMMVVGTDEANLIKSVSYCH
ncbi:hypothetical protein, partial [Serratia marcescens]|uniref:hypothetical protein n=1 Tax=Serratia marcescens TaxID=615 RepID=UPI0023802CE6